MFHRELRRLQDKVNGREVEPIFLHNGIAFIHETQNSLRFVFTTIDDISAGCVVELLVRIVAVIRDYLGVLTEESVSKNHVLIYEIIDEVIDYGYPQGMSTDILRKFIHNAPVLTSALTTGPKRSGVTIENKAAMKPIGSGEATGSAGGGKEFFLDLVESIVGVFDSKGKCIRANIFGRISLKNYISGKPRMRLIFANQITVGERKHAYDTVELDDCVFNSLCDVSRWEEDNSIVFDAPTGEIRLMDYRMTMENFFPPLNVKASVQESSNGGYLLVHIKLSADVSTTRKIVHINLTVPLPKGTLTVGMYQGEEIPHGFYSASKGTKDQLKYNEARRCACWEDLRLSGGDDKLLSFRVLLKSGEFAGRCIKEISRIM